MAEFVVSSEHDAISLLKRALDGNIGGDQESEISFDGWPQLVVHLPETPIDGSISPTMMAAFLEYQEAINRSYVLITRGDPSLRTLRDDEREDLEFRVKVEKGSSDYVVVLGNIFEKIGLGAISKMTPEQVTIAGVTIAIILGAGLTFRHFINKRAEIRRAEIDADQEYQMSELQAKERAALIELQRQTAAAHVESLKLVADAVSRVPALQKVEEYADAARMKVLKAIAADGGGTVQGVTMSSSVAREIVTLPRRKSEDDSIKGVMRVLRVDTSPVDGFKVTFWDQSTKSEIVATLRDAMASARDKAIIQAAEWQKSLVDVEISGRRIGTRILDGTIVSAVEHDD